MRYSRTCGIRADCFKFTQNPIHIASGAGKCTHVTTNHTISRNIVNSHGNLVNSGKGRRPGLPPAPSCMFVAEVLAGLATVYLSRRGAALKVNKLTFTIRASDSSWHPRLPGRPLSTFAGIESTLGKGADLSSLRHPVVCVHLLSVEGLRFGVWDLGFGIRELGFGVKGRGCRF